MKMFSGIDLLPGQIMTGGKLPHELEYSFAFQEKWNEDCERFAYITMDGTQPTEHIVDQILEKAG